MLIYTNVTVFARFFNELIFCEYLPPLSKGGRTKRNVFGLYRCDVMSIMTQLRKDRGLVYPEKK